MHPPRPWGGGLGCWPSGPRGSRPAGARRGRRSRGREAHLERAVSPVGAAGRRSRARPAVQSEAVHAPLVVVHDARIDRIRQDDRRLLIGVSANKRERPLCDMKIAPSMFLQLASGVQRLRIWGKPARRRRGPLNQADVGHAMMAGLNGDGRPRPYASHDDDNRLSCV